MRILNVFNNYLEPGGEANAVSMITASLAETVELRRCDFSSADWSGAGSPAKWRQALWMIENPSSVRRLQRLEASLRSDAWLVHNVFPVGSAAVYRQAERLGIPVIQYLHNYRPLSVNGYLWANERLLDGQPIANYLAEIRHGAWQTSHAKSAWFAFVLTLLRATGWQRRSVKAWIAISEFVRQKFIEAGVPAADVFTLRHYWKPRPPAAAGDDAHYLFLGRLIEAKGVNVLLDAWEILEKQHGSKTPRLIVAGDGPLRAAVAERAERSRSVHFAGSITGAYKEEALRNAKAVIVPSTWWEPLGLVVYEAYDFSRPVLAARSGGLAETVAHGETGFVHEPGNAAELAAHVLELESDANSRQRMGAGGREWLLRNAGEADWRQRFQEIARYATRPAA
jgi:glycosyltransferase involved in cell wall biosynthesis